MAGESVPAVVSTPDAILETTPASTDVAPSEPTAPVSETPAPQPVVAMEPPSATVPAITEHLPPDDAPDFSQWGASGAEADAVATGFGEFAPSEEPAPFPPFDADSETPGFGLSSFESEAAVSPAPALEATVPLPGIEPPLAALDLTLPESPSPVAAVAGEVPSATPATPAVSDAPAPDVAGSVPIATTWPAAPTMTAVPVEVAASPWLPAEPAAPVSFAATAAAEAAPAPLAAAVAAPIAIPASPAEGNVPPRPATPIAAPPASRAARKAVVPQIWFVVALSWASAATLLLVWTLMQVGGVNPDQLESLPDIKPDVSRDGVVQPKLVPQHAQMPVGHTLKLGESQQFGNLKVTPLRVTREPLTLVNFSDATRTKPNPETVLKLWLKFEHVSGNLPVTPLGRDLVFARYMSSKGGGRQERANNFVCRVSDKNSGDVVFVYNHVVTDVWDLKGQNVDRELQPGESFETFIPCEPEGVASLSGDLVWRVHFRKGRNPQSKRGVTTLIEVVFSSGQITSGNG